MGGHSIRVAEEGDAPRLALLHMQNLPDAFLTSLGRRFLTYLYRAFVSCPRAFCVVAVSDGSVVGFATGAEDIGVFYRHFGRKYLFVVGPVLITKIFNPKSARKVIDNMLYPSRVKEGLPRAEFLTLGVDRSHRGQGIGEALYNELVREFRRRGVSEFKAAVSDWLSGACRFHERNGGVVAAVLELHGGEKSRIYVWKT